jgi:hypothetical protein
MNVRDACCEQDSDWWSEIDGATFDVVGTWDPAGRSS